MEQRRRNLRCQESYASIVLFMKSSSVGDSGSPSFQHVRRNITPIGFNSAHQAYEHLPDFVDREERDDDSHFFSLRQHYGTNSYSESLTLFVGNIHRFTAGGGGIDGIG